MGEQLYFEDFGDGVFPVGWDNRQSANWGVGNSYQQLSDGSPGPNLSPPGAIFNWSPRLSCGNYPNNCNNPPSYYDGCDPDYAYSDTLYSPNISIGSNTEVLVRFDFGLKYWADCQTHYNGMVIAYFNGLEWVDILVYEIGIDAGFVSIDRRTESFIAEIESGNEVQIRWIAYGTDTYWIDGWVIDNLEILTLPTIDEVSISSDNIDPATASSGSEIFLDFISESNLNADPVVQINRNQASVINTGGLSWRGTYFVTTDDPDGPIEFTIDFTDIDGIDGITVKETDDESVVVVDNSPPPRFDVGLVTSSGGNVFSNIWNSTNTEVNLEVNVPQDSAISNFNFSNGNSLLFDGIDDVVEIDGNTNYRFSDQFTIEAWIRTKSQIPNNYEGFLSYATFNEDDESGSGFGFVFFATGWRFYLSTADEIVYGSDMPSASAPKDQWTHLAATYNGDIIKLYRNGILVDSKNTSGNVRWSEIPSKLTIGSFTKDGITKNFNGNIDEVRLWNYPLSQTTIKSNLFNNYTGSDSGLVGYWKIDEGSGTNIDASDTVTNNSGAINGASWDIGESPIQFKTPLYDTGVIVGSTFQLRGRINDNLFEPFGDKDTITINDFNLGTKIVSAPQNAFEAIESFRHDSIAELSAYLFDDAGNYSEGDTSITNLFIDIIADAPNLVSILSDNTFSYLATINDMISINSEFDEDVEIPELMVDELNAPIGEDLGSETFLNTYSFTGIEPEGTVDFTLLLTDYLGNPGSHSGTTDGTSVIFDKTPSVINSISIESNNADIRWAKVGDVVRMDFESNETLYETQVSLSETILTLYDDTDTEYIGFDNCNNREVATSFYVEKIMTLNDNEGRIPISIIHNDCAGNDGTEMTETIIEESENMIFDGINDYVQLPQGIVSDVSSFTFMCWFKTDINNSWARLMDFGSGTSINMFLTPSHGGSGIARFAIKKSGGGEQQLTASSQLELNQWYHIAVTIDSETDIGNLYIDGVLVTSNTITNTPMDLGNTTQNYFGKSQYNDPYFGGSIGDVMMWNRALNQDEININMDNAPDGAGLIGYWDLSFCNNGIVNDQSNNGNNGTTNIECTISENDEPYVIFDKTPPSDFIVGTVISTGGNQIENVWNSTNEDLNVTVPVDSDTTLKNGWIQVWAKVGNNTYEELGEISTINALEIGNNKTISFTAEQVEAITGFMEDSIITIKAIMFDRPGNEKEGLPSDNQLIIDQTPPSMQTAHIESDYSDSTLATVGNLITVTFSTDEIIQTPAIFIASDEGEVMDLGSFNWSGSYTMTDAYSDGPISFSVDSLVDIHGNPASGFDGVTDDSEVIFDNTQPTLNPISIFSNNLINTDRAKVNDQITITFTGEESLMEQSGTIVSQAAIITDLGGDTYKAEYQMQDSDPEGEIAFELLVTDLVGIVSEPIIETTNGSTVIFDRRNPELDFVHIESDNSNNTTIGIGGNNIILTFTADESLTSDSVNVTIADTVASISESGGTYTATTLLTGNEPDGLIAFTIDFMDLAGNVGTQIVTTTDNSYVNHDVLPPEILSVSIASNNADSTRAKVGDSIFVSFSASEVLDNLSIVIGGNNVNHLNPSPAKYKGFYLMTQNDLEGIIDFNIAYTDLGGESGPDADTTTNNTQVLFDKTIPEFSLTRMFTNNIYGDSLAGIGTTDTLQFEISEPYKELTVMISGNQKIPEQSELRFKTYHTFTGEEEDGWVDFSIFMQDSAGNESELLTETQNNSKVRFDGTRPTLTYVNFYSNNINDSTLCIPGDSLFLIYTVSETLRTGEISIAKNDPIDRDTTDGFYTAAYKMIGTESEGFIPFSIGFEDWVGNSGDTVRVTTNESSVLFDMTPPEDFELDTVYTTGGHEVLGYWNSTNDSVTLKVPIPTDDETLIGGFFQPQVRFGDGSFTNLGPQIPINGGLGMGYIILDISRDDFIAMDGYEENSNAQFTAIAIDKAGNITVGTSDNSILHIDEIIPELTTFTIKSNNSLNEQWAKVSDQVIFNLTSNEGLDSLVGIMILDTLVFNDSNSGSSWDGMRYMSSDDPEGPIPYYITFFDSAGNAGQLVTETTDGSMVRFDKYSPEISNLLEGHDGEDIYYYNRSDSLTLYWSQNDNYSGTRDAFIALGTNPLSSDIIHWTPLGLDNYAGLGNLSLVNDSIYYGGVFIRDSAGNHSDTIWGDGIYIDTQIPQTGEINDGYWVLELDHVIDSTQLQLLWKNFSDNTEISYYEIAIGTGEDSTNIMDWMRSDSSDSMTVTGLNLVRDTIYYSFIRSIDLAGNMSIAARTDGVIFDNAKPEVNRMTPDPTLDSSGYVSVLNNDTVLIKFNRPIYTYNLFLDSKLDSNLSFSHNYSDSTITIFWDDTLASYDTITVVIDSAVAFNTMSVRDTLQFYSQLWGDLNLDYDLTVEDILIFNKNWPNIDIGPFNNSPPHVRPRPDGLADLTDLSAFAKMWQWKYFSLEFDTIDMIRNFQSDLNISAKGSKVFLNIPKQVNMAEILFGYSNLDVRDFRIKKSSESSFLFTAVDTKSNLIQFSLADSEILDTVLTLIIPKTEEKFFNSKIQYTFMDNNGEIILKGVEDYNIDIVPEQFFVYNNYPNPFNPITTIQYDLPDIRDIKIEIYNILGKRIKSLSIKKMEPGHHSFNWYGKNDYGHQVSTGIYFLQLTAGQETQVQKMLLLK